DFIDRVSVVLYDPPTDILKTYLQYPVANLPMQFYQARLSDCFSLQQVVARKKPRVVHDMEIFSESGHQHSKRILEKGFRASYTKPIYIEGQLFGFIFVNSYQSEVFTDIVLDVIDPLLQLLSLSLSHSLKSVETLYAALRTTQSIVHHRDPETGSHLERMSRYSRLIARVVAPLHDCDDEFVESVFHFSPIHDIGKIAIADEILLKPANLSSDERKLMQAHSIKGAEMVEMLISNFHINELPHVGILKNISRYHHEAIDGSGYPDGLKGDAIPLEARIVAVADIFDALTSKRPYKQAWSNGEAIDELKSLSGKTLAPDCVAALIDNIDEVERIQQMFLDESMI
ncbi:MAG: HD domain-containing protein, partial [Gammaproteobacteria bacterium]|nr:HD domain-containing protein [Gammaproteobacteria bacterium]